MPATYDQKYEYHKQIYVNKEITKHDWSLHGIPTKADQPSVWTTEQLQSTKEQKQNREVF